MVSGSSLYSHCLGHGTHADAALPILPIEWSVPGYEDTMGRRCVRHSDTLWRETMVETCITQIQTCLRHNRNVDWCNQRK